tara:strand:- start:558 stop:1091 length:534 start_codon:yes stop_codon:yes gene_type:complete
MLSLFLAYQTYKLTITFIELAPEKFSTLAKVVSAIAFTFFITGVLAFLGFVYPTSKILPKTYYQIENPKKLEVWYTWLGVAYFRWFLLKTFYRKKENKKYFNGTKSGIMLFDYNTKQSEFGHLIAFILVFALSVVLLFKGHTYVFIWIQPLNIILNFYPILLQRKHRIPIQRLLNKM